MVDILRLRSVRNILLSRRISSPFGNAPEMLSKANRASYLQSSVSTGDEYWLSKYYSETKMIMETPVTAHSKKGRFIRSTVKDLLRVSFDSIWVVHHGHGTEIQFRRKRIQYVYRRVSKQRDL